LIARKKPDPNLSVCFSKHSRSVQSTFLAPKKGAWTAHSKSRRRKECLVCWKFLYLNVSSYSVTEEDHKSLFPFCFGRNTLSILLSSRLVTFLKIIPRKTYQAPFEKGF
jgi:hypothetical protein